MQGKEWWDEECRNIIKETNDARIKTLQIKTRASQEDQTLKRKVAKKIYKTKKKNGWMKK